MIIIGWIVGCLCAALIGSAVWPAAPILACVGVVIVSGVLGALAFSALEGVL